MGHPVWATRLVYLVTSGSGCGGAFPTCSFPILTPGQVTPVGINTAAAYDTGTIMVQIDSTSASYTWGSTDSAVSVANGLAAAINKADGGFLTATVSCGTTIKLSSTGTGVATNWPVTITVSDPGKGSFPNTFAAYAGSEMLGGQNGAPPMSSAYAQLVYTPSGQKLATVQNGTLVSAAIPLTGGTAVYNASGFSYFRHKDWLGSSRLATTWDHQIYSKTNYAPFGETYNEAGTQDRSFTGQDQDASPGMFDFLFRKYDPVTGRWLSPDPSGWAAVSALNPQSLNRYAYVLNNPMSLTDPDGLDCVYQNEGSYSATNEQVSCSGTNGIYVPGTITNFSFNNGALTQIDYTTSGLANFGQFSITDSTTVNVAPGGAIACYMDASCITPGLSSSDAPNFQSAQSAQSVPNAPNHGFNTKTYNTCLNNFNQTGVGKVTNFFSLASPLLGPERMHSTIEDVGGTALKFGAYQGLRYLEANSTQALTALGSGAVADIIHFVAADIVAPVAGVATGLQVGVHAACAAYSTPSLVPYLPPTF
jgi:RHS repeat-associated protein